MDNRTTKFLDSHLSNIYKLLKKPSGQFLLISPDETLLSLSQKAIVKHTRYEPVWVTNEKDFSPNNKIFFINLRNKRAVGYQVLLYYYLELPLHHDCFICLASSSSMCLNYFEKRVQSRFKHFIVFIPYFLDTVTEQSEACDHVQTETDWWLFPTIRSKENDGIIKKYGIEKYTLSYFFSILEPLHLTILILIVTHKIKRLNLIKEYRQFILDCRELKGVSNTEIFYKYCDLLDAGLVDQNGDYFIDVTELREYITKHSPNYLKRLLYQKKFNKLL